MAEVLRGDRCMLYALLYKLKQRTEVILEARTLRKVKRIKNIPKCVGVVMDGNRRFAKLFGRPLVDGYKEGYKRAMEIVDWAIEFKIETLILYALSSENLRRPEDQVALLLNLLRKALADDFSKYEAQNIRLSAIGDLMKLPEDIRCGIQERMEQTKYCKGLHVVLAVSYGGRDEIAMAASKILAERLLVAREGTFVNHLVTENDIAKHLYTGELGIPDPDLIIRFGGETRMSNFLPWQSTYSEWVFPKKLWAALTRRDFLKALIEFDKRDRRQGR